MTSRAALATRVRAFMDSSLTGAPSEPFAALALDIHAWQRARDPVVHSLITTPVTSWQQIPAVPVTLFKELPVGTLTQGEPHHRFQTSGTTGSGRGVHRLRDTELYDHGSLLWARHCVPDAPTEIVALLLDPTNHPGSSLSHMVNLFGQASWHLGPTGVQLAQASQRVRQASGPVYLCATAFALAEWLNSTPPALPNGSVVMVTGGFKGRVHDIDHDALYDATQARLRPSRLVTEYGMTELSSQLWGAPGQPYRPPPWLRVRTIDPISGAAVMGTGQLVFTDLANVDGTLSVETLDEGVVHADGSVSLHGRVAEAPARGCSLTVEEAWRRR